MTRQVIASQLMKHAKICLSHKERSIDAIPPTADVMLLHVKRVSYQAGCCWGQIPVANLKLPSPEREWCKGFDENWEPFWFRLQSHKYHKAAENSLRCGYQASKVRKGGTSVHSNV